MLPISVLPVLLACLVTSSPVSAKIYRWVDADGRVHYSDRPQTGADAVDLYVKGRDAGPAPSASTGGGDNPLLGPYRGFEIVSPEPNQTMRLEQPNVPISLIVDPSLIAGHRLELAVDGNLVSVDKAGTQLTVTGLGYGTHRVQARIRDAADVVVARTATLTFHLRKPIPPGVLQ